MYFLYEYNEHARLYVLNGSNMILRNDLRSSVFVVPYFIFVIYVKTNNESNRLIWNGLIWLVNLLDIVF